MMLFADDFKIFKHRETSAGVCNVILSNLHHGICGHRYSPAIAPLMFWDTIVRDEVGYDAFIDHIAPGTWRLAKGIPLWSAHHRCVVWAIALLHLLTGDGPGRSSFGKTIISVFQRF
jgi:hypothetical protein